MPLSIGLAFLWAPPAEILGDASRVIYFHVPLAWGGVLAFIVSGIFSILFLLDKERRFQYLDERAYNSASIGLIFTLLATVTGSLWAKISWGSYWNWDPRQISIVLLLSIYIAYICLWQILEENPNKGNIGSVYLIFAMFFVPPLGFIIPRIYRSLHPDTIINADQKMHMDATMAITLVISVVAFTLLYVYLLSLKNRLSRANHRIDELYDQKSDNSLV